MRGESWKNEPVKLMKKFYMYRLKSRGGSESMVGPYKKRQAFNSYTILETYEYVLDSKNNYILQRNGMH